MNPRHIDLFQREIIDEVIRQFDNNMMMICRVNEMFQLISEAFKY